jgi:hypothetical protein
MKSSIVDRAYAVFHDRSIEFPPMSLRAGNAIDSIEFLEFLAFDSRSIYHNNAIQVLEEYWL